MPDLLDSKSQLLDEEEIGNSSWRILKKIKTNLEKLLDVLDQMSWHILADIFERKSQRERSGVGLDNQKVVGFWSFEGYFYKVVGILIVNQVFWEYLFCSCELERCEWRIKKLADVFFIHQQVL